jgi:hypothetical protein
MNRGKVMKKDTEKINVEKAETQKAEIHKTAKKFGKWKILAIAVIAVFVVLIAISAARFYYHRPTFIKPTHEQTDLAVHVATEKLQSLGIDEKTMQLNVAPGMRKFQDGKTLLQVNFKNVSTSHTFLVDIDAGVVVVHSQTDWYVADPSRPLIGPNHEMPFEWVPFSHRGPRP